MTLLHRTQVWLEFASVTDEICADSAVNVMYISAKPIDVMFCREIEMERIG